ncbi:hypothetical protein CFOL_v3_09886 [Cephalotus follicularis]|uniref:Uncharacterized protein n=1 Tax=Cephalotus follicularis TaxID=3775 RepID=A0A1Q3BEB9_CEPFO|nr:hypothetical protein CFOL_v3_09886 [Cephalotus follicularis]
MLGLKKEKMESKEFLFVLLHFFIGENQSNFYAIHVICLCMPVFSNVEEHIFQGLTSVEYLMLLYRALLPTPAWYRFFLDKEYGSLFSSLMTGLYLTFKLTYVAEKV